jgi:hypothetical protein
MFEYYLIAVAIGIIAELSAKAGRFWLYRKPVYPVINVLVVFGVVNGLLLASAVPALGYLPVFLLGWVVGYAYEQLNFVLLSWWDFPDDRFLVFRGRQACAVSVGVLWGLVPVTVHGVGTLLN